MMIGAFGFAYYIGT